MITLSVFFDAPFWVGVFEIVSGGEVRATRVVLGSEPTGAELHAFLLRQGVPLLEQAEAAPPVPVGTRQVKRPNPKRAAKLAARAAREVGVRRTASQEAMRLALEARKKEAATRRKAEEQSKREHRREVARRKRLQRRRGH